MSPKAPHISSKRSLPPHKSFYAIHLPRNNYNAVVSTWKACEAIVKGQSGARYKKLASEDEAKAFLAQFTTTGETGPSDSATSSLALPPAPAPSLSPKPQQQVSKTKQTPKKSVYYAVYLGRTHHSHILEDWESCKALVSGEATAQFKKLRSYAEAERFLAHVKNKDPMQTRTGNYTPKPLPPHLILSPEHDWNVYTDGSHIKDIPYIGWGWCLVRDEETILAEDVGIFKNQSKLDNVAGELQAVLNAVSTLTPLLPPPSSSEKPSRLTISYDYTGVEQWASAAWKTKNPFTENYQATIQPFLEQIRFNKVDAHGANPWNDRVDKLVRTQLKIKGNHALG